MSLKTLTQLSHFTTMLFGISFGMSISLLYQHCVTIFIFELSPVILLVVFFSICLRVLTIFIWKKNNFKIEIFEAY